ncbi:FMN-binding glutamate synthase family protein [Streptomyces sp. NPDC090052]|uniref:FMN-binding glutamate synthase family protein n=1 Tax=unclassified Streptomyces TaxID=2593676 RepID=UPI0022508050|nr:MULTISPECIES: FMN-binding glutamate synthase family protein [unclassified Streptomyces]MCX4726125.1 FMN-binding glutamate synthase family protein [Streptomyces sp. NBC_01306]WSV04529.1 FMN-binding glutamate synthase family protein [Streptomyces sp. NBC_01020]WSX42595.1 FMN-binding glutamate synthase family protein [Streptomyces sp. NBC_00963]
MTVLAALAAWGAAGWVSWWWLSAAVPLALLGSLGVWDLSQRRHTVLRNYPIIGHARYLLERVRPELQQYFVERNYDGRPFDRDTRSIVYERAKGTAAEEPFGTERDVYETGYESLVPSMAPCPVPQTTPRVRIGGPDCTRPYDMALLNVSAMSFGSLSANAVLALNGGAAAGGFAHDTGEGGLSEYHLRPGGDLVWEIGTGYFGCRTDDGGFKPEEFADKAAHDQVKCVSLKLSQGAKPGIGGVLPGAKVNAEIARARGVPQGETVISPPYHREFSTPRELVRFLVQMRELSGGKPTGFKLCPGSRRQFLAVCKAMLEEGTAPDFIIVDGAEGGTGAAPLEYADQLGTPLTDGLLDVHNALVGTGLRDRIRIGASGKIATGADLVKRLLQGADYGNAARAMMFAVGCIQAQRCHTNTCPAGVTTQDPRRARALHVGDKTLRVQRFQHATVASAQQIMASMGVADPADLRPHMLRRRTDPFTVRSYEEMYEWLAPGQLLAEAPESWAADWRAADPDRFTV